MPELELNAESGNYEDTEEALRSIYGGEAVFSFAGRFTLVHLDNPGPEDIRRRVEEFDPNVFFLDACPLCAANREAGGEVIFSREETACPDALASGKEGRREEG